MSDRRAQILAEVYAFWQEEVQSATRQEDDLTYEDIMLSFKCSEGTARRTMKRACDAGRFEKLYVQEGPKRFAIFRPITKEEEE